MGCPWDAQGVPRVLPGLVPRAGSCKRYCCHPEITTHAALLLSCLPSPPPPRLCRRCPTAITGAAAPAPLQQAQAAGAGTAAQLGGTGSVLAGGGLGASPGALASALQAALSCLVPLSAALPLTVEACNRCVRLAGRGRSSRLLRGCQITSGRGGGLQHATGRYPLMCLAVGAGVARVQWCECTRALVCGHSPLTAQCSDAAQCTHPPTTGAGCLGRLGATGTRSARPLRRCSWPPAAWWWWTRRSCRPASWQSRACTASR